MTDTPCLAFVWEGREAGTSYLTMARCHPCPNYMITAITDIYTTSLSAWLWKTVHHRQDYIPIPVANKIQDPGPQADDILHIQWRQREREAGATGFSRQPYATPEWLWIWHASKIYGITGFMLKVLLQWKPTFVYTSCAYSTYHLASWVSFGHFYVSFRRCLSGMPYI